MMPKKTPWPNLWSFASIIPSLLVNACVPVSNSSDVKPAYREVSELLEKRQLDKAQVAVQKILVERPNEGDSHYFAGLLAIKKRDYAGAVSELNKALELDPKNPKAYSDRGFALLEMGKNQSALDDLNEAIKSDPTRALNYHRRALIEHQLKQYAAAVKDFDESEKIDPTNFPYYLHYGRAESYVALKQYDKAMADYEKAVAIMPAGDNRASVGRAMCRLRMGDLDAAKKDCAKLMQVAPHDATALALTGTVALLNGDKATAVKDYRAAAQSSDANLTQLVDFRSPKGAPAAELASVYLDLKKPQLAVALMSTIEIDRPLEASEELQLGRAYLALKQDERGLKLLNSAISTDPDNISPRLVMIEFYKQRGLLQKAEEVQMEGLSMAKTANDKSRLSAALK